MKDWKDDSGLHKYLQPLATFKKSGFNPKTEDLDPDYDFLAIMEAVKDPIYIFTYNVEMT